MKNRYLFEVTDEEMSEPKSAGEIARELSPCLNTPCDKDCPCGGCDDCRLAGRILASLTAAVLEENKACEMITDDFEGYLVIHGFRVTPSMRIRERRAALEAQLQEKPADRE